MKLELIVVLLLGFVCGVVVVGGPLLLLMIDIYQDLRRWRRLHRLRKDFDGQQWD